MLSVGRDSIKHCCYSSLGGFIIRTSFLYNMERVVGDNKIGWGALSSEKPFVIKRITLLQQCMPSV